MPPGVLQHRQVIWRGGRGQVDQRVAATLRLRAFEQVFEQDDLGVVFGGHFVGRFAAIIHCFLDGVEQRERHRQVVLHLGDDDMLDWHLVTNFVEGVVQRIQRDEGARPGIGQLVLHLVWRIERVRRHRDGPGLEHPIEGDGELWHIGQADRHAVAVPDAHAPQRAGEAVSGQLELQIGQLAAIKEDRRAVAAVAGGISQQLRQRDIGDLHGRGNARVVVPLPGKGRRDIGGKRLVGHFAPPSDERVVEASLHSPERILPKRSFLTVYAVQRTTCAIPSYHFPHNEKAACQRNRGCSSYIAGVRRRIDAPQREISEGRSRVVRAIDQTNIAEWIAIRIIIVAKQMPIDI